MVIFKLIDIYYRISNKSGTTKITNSFPAIRK